MKMLIKICGIKTVQMAEHAINAGADMIGLVFCQQSPRYIDIETAEKIVHAARVHSKTVVAVFSDADENTIQDICNKIKINHIQHHGDQLILQSLSENLHKIYTQYADHIRPEHDYLLIDGPEPGSGRSVDYTQIHIPEHIKVLIAGGLQINNIHEVLHITNPHGVDVSSGVESSRGEKSSVLIAAFIEKVRTYHE